jgi:protein-tyrosine phosphatase/arsenate reductase
MNQVTQFLSVLSNLFGEIPEERKNLIKKLADYGNKSIREKNTLSLLYVCIHNSRRSHFGQAWGAAAAAYFGFNHVYTFSGGTEVTAIHPNTIAALQRAGWILEKRSEGNNPVYAGYYHEFLPPLMFFSKEISHPANPKLKFAAVMTCGEAEENCPFVPGADLRVSLPYSDPKYADHTPEQDKTYDERCRQIALENLFLFSEIKSKFFI